MTTCRTAVTRSALIGFAALSLVGCTAITGKSLGHNIDDATITSYVKAKLAADQSLSTITRIGVDTTKGVVSLNGIVDSDAQRLQAAELARQVEGVRKVDNNLQVKHQR